MGALRSIKRKAAPAHEIDEAQAHEVIARAQQKRLQAKLEQIQAILGEDSQLVTMILVGDQRVPLSQVLGLPSSIDLAFKLVSK